MAQYRSSLLIIICLTGLGLSPGPGRATVESSQEQKAIAPYSQKERSLLEMAEADPKVIASSSMALEMAQATDSKTAEEKKKDKDKDKEKKKKADSGTPKPVRMVLGLLRGRKTLLALSLISVLITGMAVFILLKLFDDSQPEDEEADLPPELENLERSLEEGKAPELEEKHPYFEATEPVFKSEIEFPHARGAGVEEVKKFVEADTPIARTRPKISPLAQEEVVAPWQGLSDEMRKPTYHEDNNGRGPTVFQPPTDTEIDLEIETEIQTKLQEEDSHTSSPWETSTPTMEPELVDRPYEESHPPDEIKDTVGAVSRRGDREPTDRHRADIELRKETAPSAPVNVVEQLIEELQNTDAEDRQNAIWQLGEKGDSRAIEPLVNLLRESDSKQQSMILATLSQIGNKTLKPMVRALSLSLQNDNQEVRINAIRDLTDVYDAAISVSNILQYAAEDPDDKVRETAKWALEKLNRIRPPRNFDL